MTNILQRLIDAFRADDVEQAKVLERQASSEPHDEIETAIEMLQGAIDRDSSRAPELDEIVKRLMMLVGIGQSELQRKLLPRLCTEGKRYRKFREVHARKARPGETIVSVTSDGEETKNTAKAGDWVVRNTTPAREEYIVSEKTFASRYRFIAELGEGWARYQPLGEVLAVKVDGAVLELLGASKTFYIEAPWGEPQRVRQGDELAAPPALDEVYRIARAEFDETYERIADD
jgi:hypothetical protein